MSIDHKLLSLLVCPVCKGPLQLLRAEGDDANELACPADRLAFPVRDGMAIMLESEARSLDTAADSTPSSVSEAL
jgi:uncharacterized protein